MSDTEVDIPAEVPDKLFFRIGEVSELVGVEPHVLRYWESEFRMRPSRSPSGQRMYKRKDIGQFLRIRKLLHDEGFTIAGARKALSDSSSAPEPGGAVGGDPGRVAEAKKRIEGLRGRIAATRKRFNDRGTQSARTGE